MTQDSTKYGTISGITLAAAIPARAADREAVAKLIANLRSPDEQISGQAWQQAGPLGASAVSDLGKLMADGEFEVARSARRALRNVVRYSGRPGAENESRVVRRELVRLLKAPKPEVRKEAVWLLSEIGDEKTVKAMASLLVDPDTREDARCAILRMPQPAALKAFKQALGKAPDDFKYALADSLRTLGEPVTGWPSKKLIPTARTSVEPIRPK